MPHLTLNLPDTDVDIPQEVEEIEEECDANESHPSPSGSSLPHSVQSSDLPPLLNLGSSTCASAPDSIVAGFFRVGTDAPCPLLASIGIPWGSSQPSKSDPKSPSSSYSTSSLASLIDHDELLSSSSPLTSDLSDLKDDGLPEIIPSFPSRSSYPGLPILMSTWAPRLVIQYLCCLVNNSCCFQEWTPMARRSHSLPQSRASLYLSRKLILTHFLAKQTPCDTFHTNIKQVIILEPGSTFNVEYNKLDARCKDDRMAGRTKGVRHTCPELLKGRGEARYFAPKGTQGKGGVGRKSKAEGLSAGDSPRSARRREQEWDMVTVTVNSAVDGERYGERVVRTVCESNQKCVSNPKYKAL